MSLGKIHIFGLYLPSQKIKRRATSLRQHQANTSPTSMLLISCSHITKGIKRSAQKVLHVKNRIKSGWIARCEEPNDATMQGNNNASRKVVVHALRSML